MHTLDHWARMFIDGEAEFLVYRYAPRDNAGEMYPPIPWSTICAAYNSLPKRDITCHLPQVWTMANHKRVVGFVWEALHHHDRNPDNEALTALACAVHQHLGPFYPYFK